MSEDPVDTKETPPETKPNGPVPPEVVMHNALVRMMEHCGQQITIIGHMIQQAEEAVERAMAASNEGPGAVTKMSIPIMMSRARYLRSEVKMWGIVLETAANEIQALGLETEDDLLGHDPEEDDDEHG